MSATTESPSRALALPQLGLPGGPLDKAALIVVALDDERSQRLLSRLNEHEIHALGRAMSRLGRPDTTVVDRAVAEFRSEVARTGTVVGTVENTERALLRLLPPEKVAEIIRGPKQIRTNEIWEKLAGIQPQALAGYLRHEAPQTVAVILARMPAPHAARVLRLLPEETTTEVAIRLVRMDSIQQTVLSGIEATLHREFVDEMARSGEGDSSAVLAELLNRSDKPVVERLLAALDAREPDVAARVRKLMFGFEDLRRIDPGTFGILISECSADKLAIALSAAPDDLRTLFLSNMSERAGNMLKDEIENLPAQRKRVVEETQAEIVALAKRMIEEGRIMLVEEADDADGQ